MARNEGRQATIVAHSLGCLVSLYYIMQQPSEWLHQHVNSFIAISAPWAGSITALKGASLLLASPAGRWHDTSSRLLDMAEQRTCRLQAGAVSYAKSVLSWLLPDVACMSLGHE